MQISGGSRGRQVQAVGVPCKDTSNLLLLAISALFLTRLLVLDVFRSGGGSLLAGMTQRVVNAIKNKTEGP